MNDNLARDCVLGCFIGLLLAFCVVVTIKYVTLRDNKPNYEVEIWHDDDTNLTMRIFKDKDGEVLYCEPVEVEMEER